MRLWSRVGIYKPFKFERWSRILSNSQIDQTSGCHIESKLSAFLLDHQLIKLLIGLGRANSQSMTALKKN